jgi:hypothetical protein
LLQLLKPDGVYLFEPKIIMIKSIKLFSLFMLGLLIAGGGLFAQENQTRGERPERPARPEARQGPPTERPVVPALSPEFQAALLKEFDKDGDGKLSPEEARTAMMAIRQYVNPGEGFGPRGQAEDRPGWGDRERNREEMLKRFDKDGDGKLSPEEMAAAREALRNQQRGPRSQPE